VGPDAVLARNERIVYGRLTGWGQEGLSRVWPRTRSTTRPSRVSSARSAARWRAGSVLQILGDFAGGGLQLAYGVVCALLEVRRSGRGQVIDAAMIDGVMSLVAPFYAMHASGMHTDDLGTNLFDGGAPFYSVYETSDGRWVSVAPIEPQFYALLLEKLGIDPASLPDREDRANWPKIQERFVAVFRTKTRDEWCRLLEGRTFASLPS